MSNPCKLLYMIQYTAHPKALLLQLVEPEPACPSPVKPLFYSLLLSQWGLQAVHSMWAHLLSVVIYLL